MGIYYINIDLMSGDNELTEDQIKMLDKYAEKVLEAARTEMYAVDGVVMSHEKGVAEYVPKIIDDTIQAENEAKETELGQALIVCSEDVLAFEKGEKELRTTELELSDETIHKKEKVKTKKKAKKKASKKVVKQQKGTVTASADGGNVDKDDVATTSG
jgi:hypothetical protein